MSFAPARYVASRCGHCTATKPLMILLVEDYQSSRRAIASFLRLAGYEVHEADNAERACDLFQRKRFDVLITDYCLRGKANGLEVLNQFEMITPGKQKFLITGLDPAVARPQAEAIGAEFIEKPIPLDNLLRVIERFADRSAE